jgi:Tol biopolymer transport system component
MPRCAAECRALPCSQLPAYNDGSAVKIGLDSKRMALMNDTQTDGARPPLKAREGDRLGSWKKIAAHFSRDVTTVQRWERRESMPVHRHVHDKQGSVYAFRSELDAWWEGRRGKLPDSGDSAPSGPETASGPEVQSTRFTLRIRRPLGLAAVIAAVLLLAYAGLRFGYPARETWRNPLANATFTRLTDWPGIEQAAEISRDGRWASFLADHDGHMDAWLTQIGSGSYHNLTDGDHIELVNPSIRTLGFSADGSLVTVWTRSSDGSHSEDIKLMAAPTAGGELRDFLRGVAEVAWSHDGRQIVYHTTAPGDPLFVRDARGVTHRIYVAPSGVHCHFPLWSKDDAYIYFARGIPPGAWDIWRIHPSGAGLERITFHDSRVSHPVLLDEHTLVYLASDPEGSGPWLYALNVEQRVPHRISFGLERYGSLAASAGGTRLVATVDESSSNIWSAPLSLDPGVNGGQRAAQPVSLVSATGRSPRTGPDYILYVSARAGRQGIWKAADGRSRELWSDAHAIIVGAPALARDGRHIAFTVADGERTILYTMDSDGKDVRALTRSLDLRGTPAWAPDGRSIVSAVLRDGEPRLMSIFLDNSPASPLVSEYSIDPVWSPDGQFLIYSGADVGTTFPLRAVARDGRPYRIPALILTRGARRVAFGPDADSIVLLRGEVGHKNFWLVDLRTGAERQITDLAPGIAISDFDLSRNAGTVLFDRIQESSRIALIERGG